MPTKTETPPPSLARELAALDRMTAAAHLVGGGVLTAAGRLSPAARGGHKGGSYRKAGGG